MCIKKYDFTSGPVDRVSETFKKLASVWFRNHNMVAMRSTKGYIFICCKLAFSMIFTLFKIRVPVNWCVCVTERPVLVFRFRFEVFGINLLNFVEQFFVRRFIIA